MYSPGSPWTSGFADRRGLLGSDSAAAAPVANGPTPNATPKATRRPRRRSTPSAATKAPVGVSAPSALAAAFADRSGAPKRPASRSAASARSTCRVFGGSSVDARSGPTGASIMARRFSTTASKGWRWISETSWSRSASSKRLFP